MPKRLPAGEESVIWAVSRGPQIKMQNWFPYRNWPTIPFAKCWLSHKLTAGFYGCCTAWSPFYIIR